MKIKNVDRIEGVTVITFEHLVFRTNKINRYNYNKLRKSKSISLKGFIKFLRLK